MVVVVLQTLSTFMVSVLAKRYTNPSSDIIELLAGLDHIDTVFTEFVGALESLIRNGRNSVRECCPNGIGHAGQEEAAGSVGNRAACTYTADLQQRAVEVALAVAAGAYQTSLLTYFIQRDLFPAIINVSLCLYGLVGGGWRAGWRDRGLGLTTAVHPNANRRARTAHNSTLHPPRPARQLQQVRVPEPVPDAPQRLCQRARHARHRAQHRPDVPAPARAVHQCPGRPARGLVAGGHPEQDRAGGNRPRGEAAAEAGA